MTGNQKGLFSAVVWVGASRVIAVGLQAVTLALLARSFAVEFFGIYATVTAAGYLFMTAVDFGFSTRALRLSMESNASATTRNMVVLRGLVLLPLLITALLLYAVSLSHSSLVLVTCSAAIAYVAGDVMGELVGNVLLGRGYTVLPAVLLVFRRTVPIVPFLFARDVTAACVSLVLSAVVGLVAGVILGFWSKASSSVTLRNTLISSWRFFGANIATNIQRSDVLLVSWVGGAVLAGFYGAAGRVSNPLNTVTSVILQVVVPRLGADTSGADRRMLQSRVRIFVRTYALLLVGTSIFAPWITTVVLGEQFEQAWPIVGSAIIGSAVAALAQAELAWLVSAGIPKRLPIAMIVASLAGLVLLGVLTARFSVYGSAVGMLLTYLFLFLTICAFSRSAES